MRNLLIIYLTVLFLSSCVSKDEEIGELREKLNKLDSIYQVKKSNYDLNVRKLENCKISKNPIVRNQSDYELYGVWDTPVIYGGGILKLYRENNTYYKVETFSDGSISTIRMRMIRNGDKKIFNSLERTSSDRWVVYPNGSLEVIDKDGLIYSVR